MNLSIDSVAGGNSFINSLSGTTAKDTNDSFASFLNDAIGQTKQTEAANEESNALLLSGNEGQPAYGHDRRAEGGACAPADRADTQQSGGCV